MKKIVSRLLIVIFSISLINISPVSVQAATELKQVNITLNVGEKKSLDTYVVNSAWYAPLGKLTISDSSIVGLECQYDKKSDEWSNDIVGLRPGKTTVIRWHHNNTYIKFNITVKRAVMDSITSYFGLEKSEIDGSLYKEAKATDKAAQDILKTLNLEQCNSDRERINEVSKYLYKNVTLTNDPWGVYASTYGALIMKKARGGINRASELLLQNLGFDIELYVDAIDTDPKYIIMLEGIKYVHSLNHVFSDLFIGSEGYNYRYAGEGNYTGETGETLQGSFYYDESGEIVETLADSYTYDVTNEILTTHGYQIRLQEEELYYVSVKRKTHLPAWLIGINTQQQILQKGDTKSLPDDRLSSNVCSSDESIVKIEDNKIVGVKDGIAIVYRYDDTYCDAFYVMVDKKTTSKKLSVDYKADGKKYSSYKSSDIGTNRKIINENPYRRRDVWKKSVLYKFEPALNGGKLQTSYKDGYLKAYVIDANGNKQEIFDDTDYIEE